MSLIVSKTFILFIESSTCGTRHMQLRVLSRPAPVHTCSDIFIKAEVEREKSKCNFDLGLVSYLVCKMKLIFVVLSHKMYIVCKLRLLKRGCLLRRR